MTSRKIIACALLGLTPAFAGCSTVGFSREGRIAAPHATPNKSGGLPHCTARDGTPVSYVLDDGPLDSPFAYKSKGGTLESAELAEAGLPHERGAYIVLNKKLMGLMTADQKLLVIAHECAHQSLGHTNHDRAPSTAQARIFEDQADCEAVKIMRRDFKISTQRVQAAVSMFRSPLFNAGESEDPEHGTGAERYRNSLRCMPSA